MVNTLFFILLAIYFFGISISDPSLGMFGFNEPSVLIEDCDPDCCLN